MKKETQSVLDVLSKDLFFEKYDIRFVGGTALSYLIDHRLSEDLDFAMLELPKDEIESMMLSYGAKKIEHDKTMIDYAENDGEDIEDSYVKYMLDGIKVEFFTPPFNLLELAIWKNEPVTFYNGTKLQVAAFRTIAYMKTMAFWNRKKYRDLFDIYYIISKGHYSAKKFVEQYINYNITYTKKALYEKIHCKNSFYLKADDEGIHTLVENPKPYEWYRKEIENFVHNVYLEELYS